MVVLGRSVLRTYWRRRGRGDAEQPLKAWFAEARAAAWRASTDIKARFPSASFVAGDRVVFNIGRNKHRLVAHVSYERGIVLIKFVGSHAEYDAIDAQTVGGGGKG
jgi:mRNA interferase HigB